MIERLTNCPQCGGILNEAGRCEFCGSKVYDFLTIDFNERTMTSAKTYIRMRATDHNGNSFIVLAPIIVDSVELISRPESIGYSNFDDNFYNPDLKPLKKINILTTLNIHCKVIDSMYKICPENEWGK